MSGRPSDSGLERMLAPDDKINPRSFFITPSDPPSLNPFFTGRELLIANTCEGLKKYHLLALSGMPGIGKTEIVAQAWRKLVDRYERIFWIESASYSDIVTSFLNISRECALPCRDDNNNTIAVAGVKSWLAKQEHILLIFDAADHIQHILPFIPPSTTANVLVTTRARPPSSFESLWVGNLSKEESALYLLHSTRHLGIGLPLESCNESARRTAEDIAVALGCLPLALTYASSYILEASCTLHEYLQIIERPDWPFQIFGDLDSEPRSILSTLMTVVLRIRENYPAAFDFMAACCMLNHSNIPESLFIPDHLTGPLCDILKRPDGLAEIRRILSRFSLVSRDTHRRVISFNRVLLSFVGRTLSPEEKKRWAGQIATAVNHLFPVSDFDNWNLCELLLPHAVKACESARHFEWREPAVAELAIKAADYLTCRSRFSEAQELIDYASSALSIARPKMPDYEIHRLWSRASIQFGLGDYDGSEKSLQRAKALLPPATVSFSPNLLAINVPLANTYDRLGKHKEAAGLFRDALNTLRTLRSKDQGAIANCLNGLAAALYGEQNLQQSESAFKQALKEMDTVGLTESLQAATSYSGLGLVCEANRDYSQAEANFRRSLEIREQLLYPDHPVIAATYNDLAIALLLEGRGRDAEYYLTKALKIIESVFGEWHPDIVICLEHLAHVACMQGDTSKAYELLERVSELGRSSHIYYHKPEGHSTLRQLTVISGQEGAADVEGANVKLDNPVSSRRRLQVGGLLPDCKRSGPNRASDSPIYPAMYEQSIQNLEEFWGKIANNFSWVRPFTRVKNINLTPQGAYIRWFLHGTLNVCYNCIDRHLPQRRDQIAIVWEGSEATESRRFTYGQLHEHVCRCANVLKSIGINKGDRVTMYLPMIPEVAIAMLACARIGAIHSVVFIGFSPKQLASRINDCDSKLIITADEGIFGNSRLPLKANTDKALEVCPTVWNCIVVERSGNPIRLVEGRDHWWGDLMAKESAECPPLEMDAEDPLFIIYTQERHQGHLKGIVHACGGYLVYAGTTLQYAFGYRDGEMFWCIADISSIMGHSYVIYGPLANGGTSLICECVPTQLEPSRVVQSLLRHEVNALYTTAGVMRRIMSEWNNLAAESSRRSLRIVGLFGGIADPNWRTWFYEDVLNLHVPVLDTWCDVEFGGIILTSDLNRSATPRPALASRPLFSVQPKLVDDDGEEIKGPGRGELYMADAWPGIMRTFYGDHYGFVQTYFASGMYRSGYVCERDADERYSIMGTVNAKYIEIFGQGLTAEQIESALIEHPKIEAAGVVAFPDDIRSPGIYAYVVRAIGEPQTEEVINELAELVRCEVGDIAVPDIIEWIFDLPKTPSGKIKRHILKRMAAEDIRSKEIEWRRIQEAVSPASWIMRLFSGGWWS